MARPPHAREKVLDAFESLLLADGERAATMDATARAAGVSKGGLLYHFPSKVAMEVALGERLDRLSAEDLDDLLVAPDGPIAAFIRTSTATGDALDHNITAVGVLAGAGSELARAALRRLRERWREGLRPFVPSTAALDLVLLVADGVYFNLAMETGSVPELADLGEVIALVQGAVGSSDR